MSFNLEVGNKQRNIRKGVFSNMALNATKQAYYLTYRTAMDLLCISIEVCLDVNTRESSAHIHVLPEYRTNP
jgi:hypothetical protein